MWRFGNIIAMIIAAVVGGAVAAAGYAFVGTVIGGSMNDGGVFLDLATVYGLIAGGVGAAVGLAAGLGASAVLVLLRRSAQPHRRVALATLAAVLTGVAVLAWAFWTVSALVENLVVLAVCAGLVAILASAGLTLSERAQRIRRGRVRR